MGVVRACFLAGIADRSRSVNPRLWSSARWHSSPTHPYGKPFTDYYSNADNTHAIVDSSHQHSYSPSLPFSSPCLNTPTFSSPSSFHLEPLSSWHFWSSHMAPLTRPLHPTKFPSDECTWTVMVINCCVIVIAIVIVVVQIVYASFIKPASHTWLANLTCTGWGLGSRLEFRHVLSHGGARTVYRLWVSLSFCSRSLGRFSPCSLILFRIPMPVIASFNPKTITLAFRCFSFSYVKVPKA